MSLSTLGVSDGRANGLTRIGMLALPVAATTAGWAIAVENELHLLIARPATHETLHFRLLSSNRVQSLPGVPMVLAGAATAGAELVVTGADRAGAALTMGVARSGVEEWRVELTGATPIRWPIPFGGLQPMIVWQTESDWLDTADIAGGVLEVRERIPVGGPPLAVGAYDRSLWAAWAEKSAISGVHISASGTAAIAVADVAADAIAIGAWGQRAWIAWTQGGFSFLARLERERASSEITTLDLAAAAGGNLTLVPGPVPVVWSQRGHAVEGEPMRYVSALAVAGKTPILIEGLVYSVAWWGEKLAVMGSDELWFYRP